MSIATLKAILLWSLVFNYAILLLWFGVIAVAHDAVYRFNSRWFRISVQSFDTINYGGFVAYKSLITIFNLVPYVALVLTT